MDDPVIVATKCFFWSLGIGILLLLVCSVTGCMPNYSEGARTGTITKISRKGIFFKSYEGQMLLGGLVPRSNGKTTSMVANTWEFSTRSEEKYNAICAAMEKGDAVTITYKEWLIGPRYISTSYEVKEVK